MLIMNSPFRELDALFDQVAGRSVRGGEADLRDVCRQALRQRNRSSSPPAARSIHLPD